MSWGALPELHSRIGVPRRGIPLLAALLSLPGATGCPEEPPAPTERPAVLIITGSDDEVEADGESTLDITIRAFDKAQLPDNRPISVFVEGAFASSDVHTIENEGADLLGTPVNGELTFQVSCALLDTGTAKVSATNGEATNTFEFDCTEPEGEVVVEVQLDEEFPCDAVLADGQSFCRVPIYVELQTPAVTVPQAGYRLTAQVTSATLSDPAEGQDPTVTDLALLAPDDDGGQPPQEQISIQTGDDGIARFRVATRLNEPMRIVIQVTGVATVGTAPERTVSVEVDPFESLATIDLTASPQSIGSDLTTQLVVTAKDYQGRAPGVDAEVTLSVPPDSGAILRAGGAESADGQLTVNIGGGTALVEFDAPAVTSQTEYTVSVGYRPHPSLPVISDTAVVKVFPDNSLILNLEVEPAEIASDENGVATITATVLEFSQGNVTPKAGALVRFTVNSLARDLMGLGTRPNGANPALNDSAFLLTRDVTTDGAGAATALVSSRNDLVRGRGEIDVEVIVGGQRVDAGSVTITLTRQPILQSIVFKSAAPNALGVRGSPYPSSAIVSFQVFDDLAQPLPNVAMTFDLNATADPSAVVVSQGTTDASGSASTTVSAGTQAIPFSVVATAYFNGRQLTSESVPISVSAGLPSFANSSMLCDGAEQAQIEPASITCTIALADRFTNRAPGGLPVQFRAEGGNIQPFVTTGGDGTASADFLQGAPGTASASLLSSSGDSWSYGAVIPGAASAFIRDDATRWGQAAADACFDGSSSSPCSLFDLCFEADNSAADLSNNLVYCPLRIDPRDDDGCWNKLEAGAVTGDAAHLSAALLAELGISRAEAQTLLNTEMTAQNYFLGTGATADRVRKIVVAHLENMFRCGHSTACLTGKADGVPFVTGDECYSAQGCFDFDLGTDCPQDGLISITASFRGEESFTDLNGNGVLDYDDLDGNGRHNPGEPIREYGASVEVPFHDVVLDMPEAFLDKDDNCAPDDHTGSLRMTTYNAIRRSDLFSDEDGSGTFGYTVQDPATGATLEEPQFTNQQWDRDKQVFFTDHLFVIQGQPRLEMGIGCSDVGAYEECPFDAGSYLCKEDGGYGGGGVLVDCYPRASDPVPLAQGAIVEVRFRWVDANGNCYSPGFGNYAWVYEDSNYFYIYDDLDLTRSYTSRALEAGYCGFVSGPIPRREWCNAYPALGAGYLSAYLTAECFGFETTGETRFRRTVLALTDIEDFSIDAVAIAKSAIDYRISCPVAP